MTRTTLIAIFSTTCLLFLALAAWFYVRHNTILALVMLGMVPCEIVSWFVLDRAISQQRQS